jgi:hypothetical protein
VTTGNLKGGTKNFEGGIKNFKNGTRNFKGGTRNFKGEKSFPRQDEENFGKGGFNAFNSMNISGHNNCAQGQQIQSKERALPSRRCPGRCNH